MKSCKDSQEGDEAEDEKREEIYFTSIKFKISTFVEDMRVLNRKRPAVE